MSNRPSIGDYALLGDGRTAALVSERGSIDWLCLPQFDGLPVFAELVGGGGAFAVAPPRDARLVDRGYQPGTAVLETRWRTDRAEIVATDGMIANVEGALLPTFCLVRRVEALGAPVPVVVSFDPRFGHDRCSPKRRSSGGGLVSAKGRTALWLSAHPAPRGLSELPIAVDVEPGRPLTVVMTAADRGPLTYIAPDDAWQALIEDATRWRRWSDDIEYDGPGAAAVHRSLITLRLLTYSASGAPVAAPTTSLPEHPGGIRNWDYRYAWPRDASIGIGAFLQAGMVDQARSFLYWLLFASRLDRPHLPALLTIHGTRPPAERELDWSGFADSRPVRIGNDARGQHQLDNYGWVLDAMWLLVRAGHGLYRESWRVGAALADEVARRWREPDSGIWEVRDAPAHYVHSKIMAWLALDRALRIAETHRTSQSRRHQWRTERDSIAADVVKHGFDAERNTFVRAYGQSGLDAAVLLLPIVGMEPPTSPRVRGTIEAIRRELGAGGPLLYRYPPGDDGLEGDEGAFLPCSFWLVQALAATGEVDAAVALFEELIAMGGPLGLFAEEADPSTGAMLGNYPQALTHASLVQAALAIDAGQVGSRSNPSATP